MFTPMFFNISFRLFGVLFSTCAFTSVYHIRSQNEYSIKGPNVFPEMLRDLPPLNNDEEYVSFRMMWIVYSQTSR